MVDGGSTHYDAAFNLAISTFSTNYFVGRTNDRIIIFMTDGGPSSGYNRNNTTTKFKK